MLSVALNLDPVLDPSPTRKCSVQIPCGDAAHFSKLFGTFRSCPAEQNRRRRAADGHPALTSTSGSRCRSASCASASADSPPPSRRRTSGAASGSKRHTTRPRSRATRSSSSRSSSCSPRDARSATRSSASTSRSAATPTPRIGSTAARSSPATGRTAELITLAEVRHVHNLAMTPVWDVAPHPQATDREGPGSFREHDIAPFPAACSRPDWPEVPALMRDWVNDARKLPQGRRRDPDRAPRGPARPLRADPPVPRRQRPDRATDAQPPARPARLPAGDHLQGRSRPLPRPRSVAPTAATPVRSASSSPARSSTTSTSSSSRPIAGPARLVPLPALATEELSAERAPRRGDPRTPQGRESRRRDLAKLTRLGRRVPIDPLQEILSTALTSLVGCRAAGGSYRGDRI